MCLFATHSKLRPELRGEQKMYMYRRNYHVIDHPMYYILSQISHLYLYDILYLGICTHTLVHYTCIMCIHTITFSLITNALEIHVHLKANKTIIAIMFNILLNYFTLNSTNNVFVYNILHVSKIFYNIK